MKRLGLLLGVAAALACRPTLAPTPQPLKDLRPITRPVAAAPQDPWAGRKDLIPTPELRPAAALTLPSLERYKLPNGLSVLLLPDPHLPWATVQVLVRAGSIDDPADRVGLADFVAEMLRHGTKRLSADQIAETVEATGAQLTSNAGYEFTSVSCGGRSQNLELCLRMVADLLVAPSFPEKEMAEVRDRYKGSVREARDDPDTLAELHFNNLLYGDDHPAGRPLTNEGLDRITRKDLLAFHRARYVPGQALLAVSGDFDGGKLKTQLAALFRRWRAAETEKVARTPVKDPAPGLKVLLVDKPDLTQCFFALGHAGIPVGHPDRDAVKLMNYVLGGGGFSSRLMQVVRAEGGKTYGISSRFNASTTDGSFLVASFTRNAEIVATLKLVQRELGRMHEKPPTAEEIKAAKGRIVGGYAMEFQTAAQLASSLAEAQLRGLPDAYITELPLRVDRLSPQEIAAAGTKHLRPGRLVVSLVGKAAEVAPLLKAAGIPFTQLSYLDPISARERREKKERGSAEVTPAQRKAARAVLERAARTMGGLKRLSAVRALRLAGKVKMGPMEGEYTELVQPPDRLRIALTMEKRMQLVMVLDGDKVFAQTTGGKRQTLPPHKVRELKTDLWRGAVLVVRNALGEGVAARPVEEGPLAQDKARVAIEVTPAGLEPTTLVFERKSHRLVEIRYRTSTGEERTVELGDHRKVAGLLIPHRLSSKGGRMPQSTTFTKVELNPTVGTTDFGVEK
ncbi:MAG: insulinase family protein [Deltaproteobacteria bacterium]|nr:insulinase family protein [Deltaproteobacteria bacterium]